jgi:hypothetical protein
MSPQMGTTLYPARIAVRSAAQNAPTEVSSCVAVVGGVHVGGATQGTR